MPPKPAGSSIASTATRSRRCCGARSHRGCRRAVSRARRSASSSNANGNASPSSPPATGTSTSSRAPRRRFTAALVSVDETKVATGKDFEIDGSAEAWRARRRRSTRHGAGRGSRHGDVHRAVRRGEAVPVVAEGAVHDLDAAAGGRAQAPTVGVAGDARRPGPLRAGLHHLHAYRQRRSCRRKPSRPCAPQSRAPTATGSCRAPPGSSPPRSRTRRRPTRPSGRRRRCARPTSSPTSSTVRSSSLYRLVWQRTLASQMADAVGTTVSVRLAARASAPRGRHDCEFAAAGTTITFPGYRQVYVESTDDGDTPPEAAEALLPVLAVGDIVPIESITPNGHATSPRPGSPRPRSSSGSRSSGSAGRRRGRTSSRRSRIAATCGRRARRSCRRGPPSPSWP